jgi:hypothetical protein
MRSLKRRYVGSRQFEEPLRVTGRVSEKEPGMTTESVSHGRQPNHFDPTDLSTYMLELPKSRPGLWVWLVFAVLTGTILALAMLGLENLVS